MRGFRPLLPLPFIICLAAGEASAHDLFKGGNDFYDGLLHPLLSLPHVLIVLSLGILMGRQFERLGPVVFGVFLASLVAGLACATFSLGFQNEATLLAVAATLGLLLAWNRPLPLAVNLALTFAAGLVMGLDFALEEAGSKGALNTGTGVTLYFCFLVAVGFGESFSKREWQRISQRVLGSWIAACALLAISLKLFVR